MTRAGPSLATAGPRWTAQLAALGGGRGAGPRYAEPVIRTLVQGRSGPPADETRGHLAADGFEHRGIGIERLITLFPTNVRARELGQSVTSRHVACCAR